MSNDTYVDMIYITYHSMYPGMNSLVMYTFHECLSNVFPVSFHMEKTHAQQLVVNLWGPVFWCAFTFMMFEMDIFICST